MTPPHKHLRAAIYARVSTLDQEPENQLIQLRRYTEAREWTAREYVDKGVSGAKDSRPALNRLVKDAKQRRFDVLVVWRLDRLGRSLRHLILLLDDLQAMGVKFVSLYGAEFRTDVESFVSREAVGECVVPDRRELPPVEGVSYFAFTDPSGGSSDSFTLAVGHKQSEAIVVDCVREVRPPFSPESVVTEFVALLKQYGVSRVTGDRYGGEFPRELFRKSGVEYELSPRTKSEIYGELLPVINSGQVELLDHPRLLSQLLSLERRTSRGGKDSIDHPAGRGHHNHDDVINCVAGVVTLLTARQPSVVDMASFNSAFAAMNAQLWRPSPWRL